MVVSVEELKGHLNIDDSYVDDDIYLQALIDASEAAVENHLQRTFKDLSDIYKVVPTPVKHAIKLFAAHLYSNREPVTFGGNPIKIELTYEYLLAPYLKY